MVQQYNVLTAKAAGAPWSNAHGSYQGFFLDIEGHEGTVLCNRKEGNPPPSGPTWGEMTLAQGKKGPYHKFSVKAAPEGSTAQSMSLPGVEVGQPEWAKRLEGKIDQVIFKLNGMKAMGASTPEKPKDILPNDNEITLDDEVDLSEIPF